MTGRSSSHPETRLPVSARLKARKETIIGLWMDRVRQDLPAASAQGESWLHHRLSKFLDRLVIALAPERLRSVFNEDPNEPSQTHGQQRSRLEEYSLQRMLREYQLLREVIFQVVEQEGPLPSTERDIILSTLEQGVAEAGARFMQSVQSRERAAEEHFRSLLEEVPHVVWFCHPNARIEFISREWTAWTGLSSGEGGTGQEFQQAIHPDDLPTLAGAVDKARETRGPLDMSYRVKRIDGEYRWSVARGNPVLDEAGRLKGWIGTTTDVHGQKLMEEQLSAARQELQQVFMRAPTPMVVVSGPEHRFTLVNPVYEDMVKRDVLGKTFKEVFSEEEAAHVLPVIHKVYETGEPHIWPELSLTLSDEKGPPRRLYLNVSYTPLKDCHGAVRAVTCLMVDVTEQVEARQVIEESETRFRQIANALPQIIWTATSDFFVDWYNDWWYKYLRLPQGTRWDDPVSLPMHPEDVERTLPRLRESVETGNDFLMEQRFRRGSDGQYRWHLVRGVPIRDPDGRIVKWVGANTDIHDQKTFTARLEEERDLRERFVTTLTHDLRTPLTAAKLNAHMVARKASDPAVLYKLAARISENLDRADQMIQDMLDANRIRAGERLPLDLSECDLNALARETLEELSLVHGDRFVLNARDALQGYWSCSGMRRIIENLCGNAIKYGARDLPVTVSLARNGPDEVLVSVHNWGNPISPEHQKILFQLYRRLDSAQSEAQKGWGLGLTLVEGLAKAHRGTVRVESTKETGTTFTVTVARDLRR